MTPRETLALQKQQNTTKNPKNTIEHREIKGLTFIVRIVLIFLFYSIGVSGSPLGQASSPA